MRIDELLIMGGDERIELDPATGLNRYGCGALPDPDIAPLGSATCSVISQGAYDDLLTLADRVGDAPLDGEIYANEAQRIRTELSALCGLSEADDVILASSGTDLHLIVADLLRTEDEQPVTHILPDPAETGRGVPSALRGRRFGANTPFGGPSAAGERVCGAAESLVEPTPVRETNGELRSTTAVDQDFEARCEQAVLAGNRVVLTLVDVSKTGIVAPSLDCAKHLKARFGPALDVLVDGCQFRLSPASLAAYRDAGFLIAITGSKFVTGPPFSGALLVPEAAGRRLAHAPLSRGVGDYSCQGDWPDDWRARGHLRAAHNPGLLFRWEAALHELRAFRALPEDQVAQFLRDFGAAVERSLDAEPGLERMPTFPMRRLTDGAWDSLPSIFPFQLGASGSQPPSFARTEAVFRRMRSGAGGQAIHLGQPVIVGQRDGEPLAALRVCASARLAVEALSSAAGRERVLRQARDAVAATAETARTLQV